MRILFVISGLYFGGAEAQLVYISRELVKRGHSVAVYTLNKHLDRKPELDGSGVHLEPDQKACKLDPMLVYRLVKFIKKYKPDLVKGFNYDGNFYGRLAAKLAGVPALDSERNDNYQLNKSQQIGEFLTRNLTRGVVANSYSGARFAQNLYRFPDEKIHVAWNGFPVHKADERLARCDANYKQLFFGTDNIKIATLVGNLKPAKDYELALKVAEELLNRDDAWRVLLVGDEIISCADYKANILRQYENHPFKHKIVLAGGRKDVLEIISQSSVLFSTSRHEGFPNVVLEAMAVSTPVVSTDYSDIKRILPEPWQVIANREPREMVDAIIRTQAEPELVRRQRQWVEANATIEKSVDAWESIFNQLIQQRV